MKRVVEIRLSTLLLGMCILGALGIVYGFLVGYKKFPPFRWGVAFYREHVRDVSLDVTEAYDEIDPFLKRTNIASLITVRKLSDVTERRAALVSYVWKGAGMPARLPDEVQEITDERYKDLKNLGRIRKLIIHLRYGFDSVAYVFDPATNKNNNLVIYHAGHEGDFITGKDTIAVFLEDGYTVMAFAMPFYGLNTPSVEVNSDFGMLKLREHDHLGLIETKEFSPLSLFIEPVVVGINFAKAEHFGTIAMIGLSGGGWTTTIISALDSRVRFSYPVAAALPIFMRTNTKLERGDYEQVHPEFYRIADYLDLYILGSVGEGRRQFQVYNKFDSCCFAGVRPLLYKQDIMNVVSIIGGSFDVYFDTSHHGHVISPNTLQLIRKDLASRMLL